MAISLIVVLYGAILAEFVLRPLRHSLTARSDGGKADRVSPGSGGLTMAALASSVIFFTLAMFWISIAGRPWDPVRYPDMLKAMREADRAESTVAPMNADETAVRSGN